MRETMLETHVTNPIPANWAAFVLLGEPNELPRETTGPGGDGPKKTPLGLGPGGD